ncbi:leucine zipper protein 1 [Protopterus annectens]|uniref:leucine zipper protein 1 n=1 Tax=Protopterus annectens TaxID=7888 RepID=UPI001CFB2A6C|nr:leucine zipper protein 1 [Protopterus annectens]XP_043916062.1 leucine zipper protein 1 [Protopterus annectens]
MAEPAIYRETSNRLLRHKLQSLGRRLDELEEATKNIQKAEEELLDLQDKIIQAEGSNSAMLAEADALRKRVLKIEGKDEEVKKAEDICRTVKEKLEHEEKITKDLKNEIEVLQKRMAELEKLEEAFNKSKTDCTQLCLSLNEEKNLTKKLTSELETLRLRLKELEESESRLDKTEQSILMEMEKLKTLTTAFVNERSRLLEKQKQDSTIIQELMHKVEQNNRLSTADQSRNATNLMERSLNWSERGRIEEEDISNKVSKESRTKGNSEDLKQTKNEDSETKEHEKSSVQEDNKVKDLNQEIEKLKNRIKQLQTIEEDLKKNEAKNGDLLEDLRRADAKNKELLENLTKAETRNNELQIKILAEQNKTRALSEQIEGLKLQLGNSKVIENGEVDTEENSFLKAQKQKKRFSVPAQPKPRDSSPSKERERLRNRDRNILESSTKTQSSNPGGSKLSKTSSGLVENRRKLEEKLCSSVSSVPKEAGISQNDVRKAREPQSALNRYLNAVTEKNTTVSWKTSKSSDNGPKNKSDKIFSVTRDTNQSNPEALFEKQKQDSVSATKLGVSEPNENEGNISSNDSTSSLPNGVYRVYRSHTPSPLPVNGNESAPFTEKVSFSSRSLDFEEKSSEVEIDSSSEVQATVTNVPSRYARPSRFQEITTESSAVKSVKEDTAAVTQNKEDVKRPFSPRMARQTKQVINPIIIDRDKKEIMGGPTAEITTEIPGHSKSAYSKVTSSITIYPSEPPSPRERHTSTTSIVLPQNESPLPKSSISLPYEISISSNDIVLKPAVTVDADSASDNKNRAEVSVRRSSVTVSPEVVAESNSNKSDSEGLTRRSHRPKQPLKEESLETKNVTVRNVSKSSRPTYWSESKSKSEDLFSTSSSVNHRSVVDNNGMNAKMNSSEPSSRRHSPSIGWEVTEELLRKSKKILNRSVADSSRTYDHRNVSGPIPWSQRLSPTRDGSPDSAYGSSISPRERISSFSSERITKTDTGNKRHSVKLEVLQNRSGSPPRPVGSRREERDRFWNRQYLDH